MYSKPQLLEAVEQEAEVNGLKAFENIVDKDGHKRFIEGTPTNPTIEGVEITYAKWSLSGTHLMLVMAGNVASTTVLDYNFIFVFDLPQWIKDKIFPVSSTYIEFKSINFYKSFNAQNVTIQVRKNSSTGNIEIQPASSTTMNDDRSFRMQFDLLIDNE